MTPSEYLREFRSQIMALDEQVSKFFSQQPTMEAAAEFIVALNMAKAEMAVVYDDAIHIFSMLMDEQKEIALEDGSSIEKKWATDRRGWKHKDLANVIAQRLVQSAVDMDTGEVLLTQEEMIQRLMDYLQPSYWRVKELEKIGINADMFCEVGETKTSIIVRKAK